MKRLWLLRHAKSSWDDAGLDDHDRPLAPRGRKAAKRMGRWAADNGVHPELVLCSTATRARATLELARDGLGRPETLIEAGLYHASSLALIERLHSLPSDVVDVLVVGHNPSLHDLASTLAPPGPAAFPTGALAELRLEIDEWADLGRGCGTLAGFVVPRSLTH